MNITARPVLFISDLHLCAERDDLVGAFERFIREKAAGAAALYILGDLFEAWVGDDQLDHDPLARRVADALSRLSGSGARIFFMHGNRDFLLGPRFAKEAGLDILEDPTVVELAGERTLLLHGDTLCTDDADYQHFRRQVRDPIWQRDFLAKPYGEREAIARALRSRSDIEKSMKAEAIMDVNPKAVEEVFERHGCMRMIHGHTHRPWAHRHGAKTRTVLADWRTQAEWFTAATGA
ncbi:MAG TPA: UDP-2,3-diacylglucosamine diphosphatase [Usitatibacteraceae bacterium]|nr:UDP-2,3-diacylglucosamine diphosphatase [Usitatibacteraceae bacterium]